MFRNFGKKLQSALALGGSPKNAEGGGPKKGPWKHSNSTSEEEDTTDDDDDEKEVALRWRLRAAAVSSSSRGIWWRPRWLLGSVQPNVPQMPGCGASVGSRRTSATTPASSLIARLPLMPPAGLREGAAVGATVGLRECAAAAASAGRCIGAIGGSIVAASRSVSEAPTSRSSTRACKEDRVDGGHE